MYNYEYENLVISNDAFDRFSDEEKEDIKQYIYDLVNRNNWLSKRTSNIFNNKKWLYEYFTKDDLKQEFYLKLFNENTIKNLMSKDILGRIKYLNSMLTNKLNDLIKQNCKNRTIPLSNELEVESNYLSDYYSEINNLFIDNTLEREIIECLENGFTRDEILEKLKLTKWKYDKIKNEIENKIKEN